MTETVQLLLCQKLAREAEIRLQQPNDFDKGIAVSMMHDAVELLLWTACKERSATVTERSTLEDMLNALAKTLAAPLPLRATLADLNKARVNFKHYGLLPHALDAVKLVGYGQAFIETAAPLLGLDVASVSRVHLIDAVPVREHLLAAEKALSEGDYQRTMYCSARAVFEARKLFGVQLMSQHKSFAAPLSNAFPAGAQREVIRSYLEYIDKTLGVIVRAIQVSRMPPDPERDRKFERIAPTTVTTVGGHEQTNYPAECTEENATFCFEYALDYGLLADRRAR